MKPIKIEHTEKNGVVILSSTTKIMGSEEGVEVNDIINEHLAKGHAKFIFDFEIIEWMNSSGLGILIGSVAVIKNNNGKIGLINVSDRIKNLLKITKLTSVFNVYDSLEDAMENLKN